MAHHFHPKKRFLIAVPLGIVAGLICVWLSSKTLPDIWWTAMMWTILSNRILIGIVVWLAWAYTHHPILGFSIPWYFRGFIMGVLVSFSLAFGAIASGSAVEIFWYTLIAGWVYGLVIDFFATKFGGEGKNIAW
jgi:hypothetical protein